MTSDFILAQAAEPASQPFGFLNLIGLIVIGGVAILWARGLRNYLRWERKHSRTEMGIFGKADRELPLPPPIRESALELGDGKVFISYRRQDTADATGRIYDRLVQKFGRKRVFKDVDNIPLGADFREHIQDGSAKAAFFFASLDQDGKGLTLSRIVAPSKTKRTLSASRSNTPWIAVSQSFRSWFKGHRYRLRQASRPPSDPYPTGMALP